MLTELTRNTIAQCFLNTFSRDGLSLIVPWIDIHRMFYRHANVVLINILWSQTAPKFNNYCWLEYKNHWFLKPLRSIDNNYVLFCYLTIFDSLYNQFAWSVCIIQLILLIRLHPFQILKEFMFLRSFTQLFITKFINTLWLLLYILQYRTRVTSNRSNTLR